MVFDNLAGAVSELDSRSFIVLMTQGHATDLPVLAEVLQTREAPYIGVLGSLQKAKVLQRDLKQMGVSDERIASFCPPKDWRSPTVLAGYNAIVRSAARRFVDTSFIVSPLWDASVDWGHVCNQASHVEALYLVAVVLGLVEPNT